MFSDNNEVKADLSYLGAVTIYIVFWPPPQPLYGCAPGGIQFHEKLYYPKTFLNRVSQLQCIFGLTLFAASEKLLTLFW